MKVVKNVCYGGFGLSEKAIEYLQEKTGDNNIGEYATFYRDEERTNPLLIEVIEALKEEANGESAELEIVEVPDDVDWYIEDYDGWEFIVECHRTW